MRVVRWNIHRLRERIVVILLGIVLLIIGFIAKIAILWTLGIIVLVIGAILAIMGALGREVGGRRHYFCAAPLRSAVPDALGIAEPAGPPGALATTRGRRFRRTR
jgi:disulfide bond formation protein DsbB